MKIFNKLIAAATVLPILAGLTSCKDQFADYSAAEKLASAQVYFSSENPSEIDGTKQGSTFEVAVSRQNTEGEITVPVTVSCDNANVTIPTSVSFKDGEANATMLCTYVADSLDYNEAVPVVLQLGDEDYSTPYGLSTYSFTFVIPMTWTTLGQATFADNFMFNNSHKITLQQCNQQSNLFRLVDPYGNSADEEPDNYKATGTNPWVEFTVYKAGDTYTYSDGTTVELDYDLVVWEGKDENNKRTQYGKVSTGYLNSSYDDTMIDLVFPGTFTSMGTVDYWTHNTVVSWQDNGLPGVVQFAPYYYMFGVGGWDHTQDDGYVQIVFPGVVLSDYSCGIAYAGKFTDTEDHEQIVVNVTLGSDVASAKAVIVEGKDPSEAIQGLADGSIEGVEVTEGENKLELPSTESGKYTVVIVTFDENGEAQDYDYETFTYNAPGTAEETWEPLYVGTYQYVQVLCNDDGTPYDDEGLVLYQSNLDAGRFKIAPIFNGVEFVFSMDGSSGELDWEPQPIGYQYSGEDIMISNLATTYEGFDASYYDGGVFHFNTYYGISAGYFGYGWETFTITGQYTEGVKANKVAKKHAPVQKVVKRMPLRMKNYLSLSKAELKK